jgi:general bacterial porin, GBP family
MKKSLLAIAALSAIAGTAQADVTLYGVIDLAVGTVSHQYNAAPSFPATVNPVSATAAPNTTTAMMNGGISPSRWGIKGSEDLGGGTKAIFTLESGFDSNTGQLNNGAQALVSNTNKTTTNAANTSLNGQLFNRQAFVGLSDDQFGTLTFGRQYAVFFDIYSGYDPVQFAQLFSPLGFSGTLGGGGGATEYLRQDNAVKYANKFGDVTVGAMYKIGGQAGSNTPYSAYGLRVGYEAGNFGIQAAYEGAKDVLTGATSGAGLVNVTAQDQKAYLVAAKYKFNSDLTGKVGYQRYTLSAPSDSALLAGLAGTNGYYGYPIGTVSPVTADRTVSIFDLGGDYNFTPKLNLAVGIYGVNYDAFNTTSGAPATQRFYSALLDYSFSKRTDVYMGAMSTVNSGTRTAAVGTTTTGASVGSATTSYDNLPTNSIFAVGVRHRF